MAEDLKAESTLHTQQNYRMKEKEKINNNNNKGKEKPIWSATATTT